MTLTGQLGSSGGRGGNDAYGGQSDSAGVYHDYRGVDDFYEECRLNSFT